LSYREANFHRAASGRNHNSSGKPNWTDSKEKPPEGLRSGMAEIKLTSKHLQVTKNLAKKIPNVCVQQIVMDNIFLKRIK
jgi:hypothetical protein